MDSATIGVLAAIGNMVLSGGVAVVIKYVGKELKPSAILLIQAIVSSISFLIIVSIMGDFMLMFTISWKALVPLILAAHMGICIGNLLYFGSMQIIGVSKAYPITMTYPLLTYILEVIIFPDVSFEWLKMLGIIIVIVGIVFISLSKVNGDGSKSETPSDEENILNTETVEGEEKTPRTEESIETNVNAKSPLIKSKMVLGIIMSIIAAITWATGTTLIRYGLEQTDVAIIPINAARMVFLIPTTLIIFLSTNRKKNKSKFTWKNISIMTVASLLGLVLSNIIYLEAIARIGSSTPSAIAASGPLIATPLSMIFLKEKVDWKIIIGTLLTVGGIIMVIFI